MEGFLSSSLFAVWSVDCGLFDLFFFVSSLPGALDLRLLQNSHFFCAWNEMSCSCCEISADGLGFGFDTSAGVEFDFWIWADDSFCVPLVFSLCGIDVLSSLFLLSICLLGL